MKKTAKSTIIIANLVPLFGAIFFGWNPKEIIFAYLFETVFISFFSVLKIRKAEGTVVKDTFSTIGTKLVVSMTKSELVRESVKLYTLFIIIYAMLFTAFFFPPPVISKAVLIMALSYLLQHGISYYMDFVANEAYKTVSPADQFNKPMNRIVVMHLTIFFGAFFGTGTGLFGLVLFIMVVIKIWVDMLVEGHTVWLPKSINIRM